MAHDQANGTTYLDHFVRAVLEHAGSSIAQPDIPPAEPASVQLDLDSPTVLVDADTVLDLRTAYPLDEPELSLHRLNTDIRKSALNKAEFAIQMFGHKNGQQLSRHLKKLRESIPELVAV